MRLGFAHSHAFPGAQVSLAETDRPGAEVEFADGTVVIAAIRAAGEAWLLDLPGYRTGKGTEVKPALWRIERDSDGTWRARRGG